MALEGAFRPLSVQKYHRFPDSDAVKRAADHLLAEHSITGPAHAAMTIASPIPFEGIDDEKLYRANGEAARKALSLRESYKPRIETLRRDLEFKKARIFNPALQSLDRRVQAHRKGETPLGDFVRALMQDPSGATISRFPTLRQFMDALILEESLNFKQAERERETVLNALAGRLNAAQQESLLKAGLAYRSEGLRWKEFHDLLSRLCAQSGLNMKEYSSFTAYARYAGLAESLAAEKLFEELSALEAAGYTALARTNEERLLVETSRRLDLTAKLVDFTLTSREWSEYRQNHKAADPVDSGLDLSAFESFYEVALERDEAMAKNLTRAMAQHKAKRVVLVTGGFHGRGLLERLSSRPVASLAPRITKMESGGALKALGVFARERAPLEKLFAGEKLFLTHEPLPPQVDGAKAGLLIGAWSVLKRGPDAGRDAVRALCSAGAQVTQSTRDRGAASLRALFQGPTGAVEAEAVFQETGFTYRETPAPAALCLPSTYETGKHFYPIYAWTASRFGRQVMGEEQWIINEFAPVWELFETSAAAFYGTAWKSFIELHRPRDNEVKELMEVGLLSIRAALEKSFIRGPVYSCIFSALYLAFVLSFSAIRGWTSLEPHVLLPVVAIWASAMFGVSSHANIQAHKKFNREHPTAALTVGAPAIYGAHVIDQVERLYGEGHADEMMPPIVKSGPDGAPLGRIGDGQPVFFFNFRTDRTQRILRAFAGAKDLPGSFRKRPARPVIFTMLDYSANTKPYTKGFVIPREGLRQTLMEILDGQGVSIFSTAETEKAPHVTSFFAGLREEPFPRQIIKIVSSPRDVATYDQKPAMNAKGVADAALEFVTATEHYQVEPDRRVRLSPDRFVLVNFANGDMVGHTNLEAAKKAVAAVDRELERLVPALLKAGYVVLITADHGSAEQMLDENGGAFTAHSANPVRLMMIDPHGRSAEFREDMALRHLAPTIMETMGMKGKIPQSWEKGLFVRSLAAAPRNAPRRAAVIVLDGWGVNPDPSAPGDAIRGNAPYYESLVGENPHVLLNAAGDEVGLRPLSRYDGKPTASNSEVGHFNMAAGRKEKQSIVKIDELIERDGAFSTRAKALWEAIRQAKDKGEPLHLLGLTSEGEVHSSLWHLEAILRTAAKAGLSQVYVHSFLDGRDTPPRSGADFLRQVQRVMDEVGVGEIVTAVGRFYAMDRDDRWERIQTAYDALMADDNNPHQKPRAPPTAPAPAAPAQPFPAKTADASPLDWATAQDVMGFFSSKGLNINTGTAKACLDIQKRITAGEIDRAALYGLAKRGKFPGLGKFLPILEGYLVFPKAQPKPWSVVETFFQTAEDAEALEPWLVEAMNGLGGPGKPISVVMPHNRQISHQDKRLLDHPLSDMPATIRSYASYEVESINHAARQPFDGRLSKDASAFEVRMKEITDRLRQAGYDVRLQWPETTPLALIAGRRKHLYEARARDRLKQGDLPGFISDLKNAVQESAEEARSVAAHFIGSDLSRSNRAMLVLSFPSYFSWLPVGSPAPASVIRAGDSARKNLPPLYELMEAGLSRAPLDPELENELALQEALSEVLGSLVKPSTEAPSQDDQEDRQEVLFNNIARSLPGPEIESFFQNNRLTDMESAQETESLLAWLQDSSVPREEFDSLLRTFGVRASMLSLLKDANQTIQEVLDIEIKDLKSGALSNGQDLAIQFPAYFHASLVNILRDMSDLGHGLEEFDLLRKHLAEGHFDMETVERLLQKFFFDSGLFLTFSFQDVPINGVLVKGLPVLLVKELSPPAIFDFERAGISQKQAVYDLGPSVVTSAIGDVKRESLYIPSRVAPFHINETTCVILNNQRLRTHIEVIHTILVSMMLDGDIPEFLRPQDPLLHRLSLSLFRRQWPAKEEIPSGELYRMHLAEFINSHFGAYRSAFLSHLVIEKLLDGVDASAPELFFDANHSPLFWADLWTRLRNVVIVAESEGEDPRANVISFLTGALKPLSEAMPDGEIPGVAAELKERALSGDLEACIQILERIPEAALKKVAPEIFDKTFRDALKKSQEFAEKREREEKESIELSKRSPFEQARAALARGDPQKWNELFGAEMEPAELPAPSGSSFEQAREWLARGYPDKAAPLFRLFLEERRTVESDDDSDLNQLLARLKALASESDPGKSRKFLMDHWGRDAQLPAKDGVIAAVIFLSLAEGEFQPAARFVRLVLAAGRAPFLSAMASTLGRAAYHSYRSGVITRDPSFLAATLPRFWDAIAADGKIDKKNRPLARAVYFNLVRLVTEARSQHEYGLRLIYRGDEQVNQNFPEEMEIVESLIKEARKKNTEGPIEKSMYDAEYWRALCAEQSGPQKPGFPPGGSAGSVINSILGVALPAAFLAALAANLLGLDVPPMAAHANGTGWSLLAGAFMAGAVKWGISLLSQHLSSPSHGPIDNGGGKESVGNPLDDPGAPQTNLFPTLALWTLALWTLMSRALLTMGGDGSAPKKFFAHLDNDELVDQLFNPNPVFRSEAAGVLGSRMKSRTTSEPPFEHMAAYAIVSGNWKLHEWLELNGDRAAPTMMRFLHSPDYATRNNVAALLNELHQIPKKGTSEWLHFMAGRHQWKEINQWLNIRRANGLIDETLRSILLSWVDMARGQEDLPDAIGALETALGAEAALLLIEFLKDAAWSDDPVIHNGLANHVRRPAFFEDILGLFIDARERPHVSVENLNLLITWSQNAILNEQISVSSLEIQRRIAEVARSLRAQENQPPLLWRQVGAAFGVAWLVFAWMDPFSAFQAGLAAAVILILTHELVAHYLGFLLSGSRPQWRPWLDKSGFGFWSGAYGAEAHRHTAFLSVMVPLAVVLPGLGISVPMALSAVACVWAFGLLVAVPWRSLGLARYASDADMAADGGNFAARLEEARFNELSRRLPPAVSWDLNNADGLWKDAPSPGSGHEKIRRGVLSQLWARARRAGVRLVPDASALAAARHWAQDPGRDAASAQVIPADQWPEGFYLLNIENLVSRLEAGEDLSSLETLVGSARGIVLASTGNSSQERLERALSRNKRDRLRVLLSRAYHLRCPQDEVAPAWVQRRLSKTWGNRKIVAVLLEEEGWNLASWNEDVQVIKLTPLGFVDLTPAISEGLRFLEHLASQA